MKRRVLSLLLTFSLIFGLLPPKVRAAGLTSWQTFEVKLTDGASYHHGKNQDSFSGGAGTGVFTCRAENQADADGANQAAITADEPARHKTSDILLQPFTIDIDVPAHTSYAVTFRVDYAIARNSGGRAWYWLELIDGSAGAGLSTQNSAVKSGENSLGRLCLSNESGGTASYYFTAVFSNTSGAETTVSRPMAYYVGTSASTALTADYHHRLTSSAVLSAVDCVTTGYEAEVNGTPYATLAEAAEAYSDSGGNPTLTLLRDVKATGEVLLNRNGTFDLAGHTLTGHIRAIANVTVQNGAIDADERTGITNLSVYPLTLRNLTIRNGAAGVSAQGALTLDNVTFSGNTKDVRLDQNNSITLGAALANDKEHKLRVEAGDAHAYADAAGRPRVVVSNWGDKMGGKKPSDYLEILPDGAPPLNVDEGKAVLRPVRVTFGANGGTVEPESLYVKSDGKLLFLPTPVSAGRQFDQWKNGETGVNDVNDIKFDQDTTLTAAWKGGAAAGVTVRFDLNGAAGTAPADITPSGTYGTLPTPAARTGYTFAGWYTAPSGGTQVAAETPVPACGHTLYAHWARDTVTVTFNLAYDGAPAPTTRAVNTGGAVGPLPTPTREGCTFKEWRNVNNAPITADTTVSADSTYFAKWTANAYTVTLNPNGGTLPSEYEPTRTVTYGAEYGYVPSGTFTREGYTFGGWYTALSGGTTIKRDTPMTTAADHTLYAHWTPKTVTVTFDFGTSTKEIPQTYGEPYKFPATVPEKSGCVFQGWFTQSGGGEQVMGGDTFTGLAPTTLYANYTTASGHTHTMNGTGSVEFSTALSSITQLTDSRTLVAGNYYLTEDITVTTGSIFISDEVNLCLNGHTITSGARGSISLNSGTTLNICDCKGTGKIESKGDGACLVVHNVGTANLYGGTFTNTAANTACVLVEDGGTLNVDGATISGQTGIQIDSGTVTVKSGSISGDSSNYSAALFINGSDGAATITGGTFKGNYGIHISTYGPTGGLTLGGSPVIQGTEADLYLISQITVQKDFQGALSVKPSGVSSFPFVIASGDHAAHFAPYDPDTYEIKENEGKTRLYRLHRHAADGTTGGTVWEPLAANSANPAETALTSGNYYLTEDLTANLQIAGNQTVNLCLNGHTLTPSSTSDVTIYINGDGSTLNLCDCGTYQNGKVIGRIEIRGSDNVLNQYGGTLHASLPILAPFPDTVWNFYKGKLKGDSGDFHITPRGLCNFLGAAGEIDMAGGSILLDRESKTPVHIEKSPASPCQVTVVGSDNANKITGYPFVVADGLPAGATLEQCFTFAGTEALKLDTNEGGEVVLRKFNVAVDGGVVLQAGLDGKLTQAQLDSVKPAAPAGQTWDGFYTAATGGEKITPNSVFSGDAVIYPRWIPCDHTGSTNPPVSVAATCAAPGMKATFCTVCHQYKVEPIPAAAHTPAAAWSTDDAQHWHECTVCHARVQEGPHRWGDPVTENYVTTQTCQDCGAASTELASAYVVVCQPGGPGESITETFHLGETVTLPSLTRAGYTLKGWELLDTAPGGADGLTPGTLMNPGDTFAMPARGVVFLARWELNSPVTLGSGPVILEDGTRVEKDGSTVTITRPNGGGTTTITGAGGAEIIRDSDGRDKITVPGEAAVQTGSGPEITLGGGGRVDSSGGVDAPSGSTVNGVTLGDGGYISSDGNVSFPEGGSVSADGGTVELEAGSEGVDAVTGEVPAYEPDINRVQIGDTVVTLPEDWVNDPANSVPDGGGIVTLPAGSVVEIPGEGEKKTTVTLNDEGGAVNPDTNEVTIPAGADGAAVKDENGGTVTVKVPEGTTGTVKPGGGMELPEGGTVTVDGGGGETEITMPDGGGTVSRDENGNLTVPEGSTVKKPDGTSEEVPDGGGTVSPGGEIKPSEGGGDTPVDPDPPKPPTAVTDGVTVTLPGGGSVTGSADGTVTITDTDGTTTTVTPPAGGGTVTVDEETGEITVPAGSTVQTGENGAAITLPEGGTVEPGGAVSGGTVQVGDVTVSAPEGETVTTSPDGETTAPAGSAVTKPDGSTEKVPAGGGTVGADGTVTPDEGGGTPTPGPDARECTVKFDRQDGGSEEPEAVTVHEGDKLTGLPSPSRSGYAFVGWYKDAACGNPWDAENDTVAGDMTLYAKWEAEHFEVSGSVTMGEDEDGDPAPAGNVTVLLKKGAAVISEQPTGEDGGYSFSGVEPGRYNVVATTEDGRTVTILVEIDGGHVTGQDLVIPGEKVNSVLEVIQKETTGAAKVNETTVGGLEEEARQKAEEAAGGGAAPASVTLTMTVVSQEEGEAENAGDIKTTAGENKILEYMEIKVEQTVVTAAEDGGSSEEAKPEPVTSTTNPLRIVIPFDFTGKARESVVVYRYHDGNGVEVLPEGEDSSGEYFVRGTDDITVYASQFSTYAVGYENERYNVTVRDDGHGSAGASETAAAMGETITLTANPDSGYHFKAWQVVSGGVEITNDAFTMPAGDVAVKAVFEEDSGGVPDAGPGEDDPPEEKPSSGSHSGGSNKGGAAGENALYEPSVTQPAHGTITISSDRARKGDKVTVTVTPEEGYTVEAVTVAGKDGKAVDVTKNADGTYSFVQPAGKVTVSARLKAAADADAGPAGGGGSPFPAYADLDASAWYHDAVQYCLENGLMNGYGDGSFRPNASLTRAMLVQILYNHAGGPAVSGNGGFGDVSANAWYAQAVAWAAENGITQGYGDDLFGPDDPITREQLALMLWRYTKNPAATNKELHFADADEADGYARDALGWAVEKGILNGFGNGLLDPGGPVARAQAAEMLTNYFEGQ